MSSNYGHEREPNSSARWLTQALIVSGALNIALVTTFFYQTFWSAGEEVAFEKPPVSFSSLHTSLPSDGVLRTFSHLSFEELSEHLKDQEKVEEGLLKRDLALGCLVAFHFFHLEKILPKETLQSREIFFLSERGEEKIGVRVYVGLSDEKFEAIRLFLQREKWPLTAEGLFFELKEGKKSRDPTLIEAFCLTEEFRSVATLFHHIGIPLSRETILQLLAEGNWETLSRFSKEQQEGQDLSTLRLKLFLVSYVQNRSLLAARMLVEWDPEFVLRKLEDRDLAILIEVNDRETPLFTHLMKKVLVSARVDQIRKKAAEKLYRFAGEPFPDPYVHETAVARFIPTLEKKEREVVSSAPKGEAKGSENRYTVQEGDSLWKIAKKKRVSIEEIRKLNHLESDKIRPGKELLLP